MYWLPLFYSWRNWGSRRQMKCLVVWQCWCPNPAITDSPVHNASQVSWLMFWWKKMKTLSKWRKPGTERQRPWDLTYRRNWSQACHDLTYNKKLKKVRLVDVDSGVVISRCWRGWDQGEVGEGWSRRMKLALALVGTRADAVARPADCC